MSNIQGILSHRKLMELKNCGVVEPGLFELLVKKRTDGLMSLVADNLQSMNKGFCLRYLGMFTRKRALMEARLMFPDRRDLLEHMIYMNGDSRFLSLTHEELNEFTVLHHAALSTNCAQKVLMCFKYSDQVIVDDETGFHIDWLLKNAFQLRELLNKDKEEK